MALVFALCASSSAAHAANAAAVSATPEATAGATAGATAEASTAAAYMGFPEPAADRRAGTAMATLGRYLFYDKALSATGAMSCATCHQQALAFTDGRTSALGATGESHSRNTPTLANVVFNSTFGWADDRLTRLQDQHRVPLFSREPIEMGLLDPLPERLLQRFACTPPYPELFAAAFPLAASRAAGAAGHNAAADPTSVPNSVPHRSHDSATEAGQSSAQFRLVQLLDGLAAFTATLISNRSPFDALLFRDDRTAISASELRGMQIFLSERLQCGQCHGGFNLSGPVVTADTQQRARFFNTGLVPLAELRDLGLAAITRRSEDRGAFRAPTLRNVTLTAPYMHDGSLATLAEVVDHYARGGVKHELQAKEVAGFELTERERQDLLAFLAALTDDAFVNGPDYGDPWEPAVSAAEPSDDGALASGCAAGSL